MIGVSAAVLGRFGVLSSHVIFISPEFRRSSSRLSGDDM